MSATCSSSTAARSTRPPISSASWPAATVSSWSGRRWRGSSRSRSGATRRSSSCRSAASSTSGATSPTCAAAGRSIVEIPRDGSAANTRPGLREAAALTLEAMRAGADVVYQATFFDEAWRGHADFLLRVDHAAGRAAERPRRLALRGRRHEAGPPRQGRRGPPGLLVRRPAGAPPGLAAGPPPRRPGRQRPRDRQPARRRLHGLLPAGEGRLPGGGRPGAGRSAGIPAGGDLPGAGRALRHLPLVGRTAATGAGPTTT